LHIQYKDACSSTLAKIFIANSQVQTNSQYIQEQTDEHVLHTESSHTRIWLSQIPVNSLHRQHFGGISHVWKEAHLTRGWLWATARVIL